ncbi:hypothetical protein TcasGA2_TC034938, partial [Tribolium castaneum]
KKYPLQQNMEKVYNKIYVRKFPLLKFHQLLIIGYELI